jgi:hypothetical protein
MSFIQARPLATHDFYAQIHKGLRFALTSLLVRLGACGGDDLQETAVLMADLRNQLHISEHHLANEDLHIHTALEARAPGAGARLDRDHDHHRESFVELEALIAAVESADALERGKRLHALYLRFGLFVADDFAHMAEEEQLILPVLQSLFTDEELIDIEIRIKQALAPEELVSFGRMMLPASTRAERVEMCAGIRAMAPPPAFAAIMDHAARPSLTPADFQHLCAALEA